MPHFQILQASLLLVYIMLTQQPADPCIPQYLESARRTPAGPAANCMGLMLQAQCKQVNSTGAGEVFTRLKRHEMNAIVLTVGSHVGRHLYCKRSQRLTVQPNWKVL